MNLINLDYLNSINSTAHAFFEWIQNPLLTEVVLWVTYVGSPTSIALLCLMVVMVMWLHKKTEHALQFIITMGTSALVTILTKQLVQLPRPQGGLILEHGYSFASGHAMTATVFFGLILYSYKNHFTRGFARYSFVFTNILAVLAIGLSRVYLGVHYMTDVLAGFFIGIVIVSVSVILHQKHMQKNSKHRV